MKLIAGLGVLDVDEVSVRVQMSAQQARVEHRYNGKVRGSACS